MTSVGVGYVRARTAWPPIPTLQAVRYSPTCSRVSRRRLTSPAWRRAMFSIRFRNLNRASVHLNPAPPMTPSNHGRSFFGELTREAR